MSLLFPDAPLVRSARLIPALARASFLWLVMFRLLEWANTGDERAVASVRRSVERRLPALAAGWRELTATCESVAT